MAFLLCMIMTVSVWADETGQTQKPDYKTDYYMIVESPEGGIDIYAAADLTSSKLNNEQIPNGTALHIEGEIEDQANHRTWGYVQYHGMYGYVPLDDCKPATKKEAIESELYLAGSDQVDYNADYEVQVNAEAGSALLYQGPGEKYGKVSGTSEISNGETIHINLDAALADGSHWGKTEIAGIEGWVNLDTIAGKSKKPDMVDMEQKKPEEEQPEAAGGPEASASGEEAASGKSSESGKPSEESAAAAEPTVTPEPTATVTPKPTATVTPEPTATVTPEPTATVTPEPTATVTPEPTATTEPEPTEEAALSPTEEAAITPAAEEEASPTPEAEETLKDKDDSGKEVSGKAEGVSSSWIRNPFVWIGICALLAVLLLLIYHFRKTKKDNEQ